MKTQVVPGTNRPGPGSVVRKKRSVYYLMPSRVIKRARPLLKRKPIRKRKVGVFRKRVKAIARSVYYRNEEAKQYDQVAGAVLSTATVPTAGFTVLGFATLTQGPAQGDTQGNREGARLRALSTYVRWQVSNTTATTDPSANKACFLRVAVLEMLDQKDEGNILTLPGNAMFERSGVNQDMSSTTQSRMVEYFNKRLYKVHYDRVYRIGTALNADTPKHVFGTYTHRWGGQNWTFDQTSATDCQERRVYMVWFIDSQDSIRTAGTTHEIRADLDVNWRLNFTG